MTTTADVLEEVRSQIEGEAGQTLNLLATGLDASTTTVTLAHATTGITAGSLLSVDLETLYVWSVDAGTRIATVRRGHGGSTAAAHDAGALVRVSGLTNHRILRTVNAEIDALSGAGLFRMRTLDRTMGTALTIDLAADVLEPYEIRVDPDSTTNEWPLLRGWEMLTDALAAEFPSGKAIRLSSLPPAGRPLRILYKAALSHLTTLADDVTATGLLASATDLPALGAAWRLAVGAETARNRTDRQGDSRRAEEVPPGAKLRSGIGLERLRDKRIAEERNVLTTRYPVRDSR